MDSKLNFKNNGGKKRKKDRDDVDGGPVTVITTSTAADGSENDVVARADDEVVRRRQPQPQQPDMMTMGISEIKRELRLYGIATDDSTLDRRAWERMLSRERRMRGGGAGGGEGRAEEEDDVIKVVPGLGNAVLGTIGEASDAGVGFYASYDGADEERVRGGVDDKGGVRGGEEVSSAQYYGEASHGDGIGENEDAGTPNSPKLRELQIAYEFERVQAQYPLSSDDNDNDGSDRNMIRLRTELESRFNISTRYFLGIREMAYALAVARVDDAIERMRLGIAVDEECPADYDGPENCINESALPTPEELIEIEYDNLLQHPSWFDDENDALSLELESQYGISAKHFMGKREMAYALAVERVSRAMQEGGGYIMDDDDYDDVDDIDAVGGEDDGDGSMDKYEPIVRTDEDMMRMMEEEMWKEEEELRKLREEVEEIRRTTTIGGEDASTAMKKKFKKEEPNLFQKTTGERSSTLTAAAYQTTPLADMVKGNNRRERRPQPNRTPLSSEPPRSFGRERQQQRSPVQMGTVIGGDPTSRLVETAATSATTMSVGGGSSVAGGIPKTDSKSKLADIIKGSEEQRRQQQRMRSRATTPPPRPIIQDRIPPSGATKKTFTTMSSRYDDSFVPISDGGRGSVNNNIIGDGNWENIPWNVGTMSGYSGIPPPFNNNNMGVRYASSWDRGATTAATTERSGAATQRPFEPAPFTVPGTHNTNSGGRTSSHTASRAGGVGPKRVPPQTPFTSPVTDGARRSGSASTSSSSSHQAGPTFTPFTAPGKRSTNGKPPPRKHTSSSDPRRFNIKDTPDMTQPFVGVGWSQAYVDQFTPYSPPLQVDPPPRDPNVSKKNDNPYYFEPKPFSSPQPHAVHSGAFARPPRDKWNRVQNNGPSSSSARTPPNNSNYGRNREGRQQRSKKFSPFDRLSDMFSNMKPGSGKEEEPNNEKPRGFKNGNVEVLPSSNGSGQYKQDIMRQQVVDVEIVNIKSTDWRFKDGDNYDTLPPPSSSENFENAWKGGSASTASSTFTTNNGRSGEARSSRIDTVDENCSINHAMQRKARELLFTNPEIRDIILRAHSNEKVRKAVHDCMGDPKSFGRYWDDPIVGPILNELKGCIK
ncbi:hypothetical protein ACHAXA_008221 [Cyclostephanos tholiformis]|uniref:Uncharacterized protein n=1 Tax=Cyclostephanos tholiformis TaxID=382380 RepID=A0ABD3R1U1_9STRA